MGLAGVAGITGNVQIRAGKGGSTTYVQMKVAEALGRIVAKQCESGKSLTEYMQDKTIENLNYWSGVGGAIFRNLVAEPLLTTYSGIELITQWKQDNTNTLRSTLDWYESNKVTTQVINQEAYYRGRVHGDVVSLIFSGLGIYGGALTAVGGIGVTGGTAGTGAAVGVPVAIAGVAAAVYSGMATVASVKSMVGDIGKYQEELRKANEAKSGDHGDLGNYKFKEGIDEDLRGGKATFEEALEMAFEKTGVPKEEFKVTEWARDKYGKSHPVEWTGPDGAKVNIDIGHDINGNAPAANHIGWQTRGKTTGGGRVRGHIFIDEVPYNRTPIK